MPKPIVTVNLKRLEGAGFVRREIDASDLRRHRLIVTPAGRRAMTRGLAVVSEGVRCPPLTPEHPRAGGVEGQALLEKLS